jgi:hypothetical protein
MIGRFTAPRLLLPIRHEAEYAQLEELANDLQVHLRHSAF